MILNRNYYSKISKLKAWWYKNQVAKLQNEKVFKIFRLLKTEWPNKLYDYSPRLVRKPRFTGNKDKLASWSDAKSLEVICPTNAIEVKPKEVIIDARGCIACGLCLEFAPEGILEVTPEIPVLIKS